MFLAPAFDPGKHLIMPDSTPYYYVFRGLDGFAGFRHGQPYQFMK
jgi:hypothetical protein